MWHDPSSSAGDEENAPPPPDIAGERAFYRGIAAGVIQQAIDDLQMDDGAQMQAHKREELRGDIRSAIEFLFGLGDQCAGWAGILEVTPHQLRRGVIATLERKTTASASSTDPTGVGAKRIRRRARLGLLRIRTFVHSGELPIWQTSEAANAARRARRRAAKAK